MSVLEALDRLTRGPMRCDDDVYTATREPGLEPAGIAAIARRHGAPLPDDLRVLLGAARGVDGLELRIDFTGGQGFGLEDLFPHALPIAQDHQGNAWIVDCVAQPEPEAAVFYACHDPPVVLWQCRGLATFLSELARSYDGDEESLIDEVIDDRRHHIWRTNAHVVDRQQAIASDDQAVRAFAATLDDGGWSIVDLRAATPGMGLSFGRYGHRTRLRRHGDLRLFACAPPERRSLLSRLLAR